MYTDTCVHISTHKYTDRCRDLIDLLEFQSWVKNNNPKHTGSKEQLHLNCVLADGKSEDYSLTLLNL